MPVAARSVAMPDRLQFSRRRQVAIHPKFSGSVKVLERCRSLSRLGSCVQYVLRRRRTFGCLLGDERFGWDSAAGIVIRREAGAILTAYDGGPFDDWLPQFCVSGSATIHQRMVDLLR